VAGLAAILLISAGRLDWIQAWALTLAFGGFLTFYGVRVLRNDPGQMNERSRVGRNTKAWDKVILTAYTVLLLAMLALAGLDAGRFGWAVAPLALQILGWCGATFAGFVILPDCDGEYLSLADRAYPGRPRSTGDRFRSVQPGKASHVVRHPRSHDFHTPPAWFAVGIDSRCVDRLFVYPPDGSRGSDSAKRAAGLSGIC